MRLPGPRLARRRVLAVGGLAAAAVAGGGAAAALGAVGRHGPSEPGAPAPGSVLWLAPSGAAPAVPGDPEPRVSVVAEQDARLITAAGSRVTNSKKLK